MLLFYIRHGDPIYDPDSLTPLGEAQAQAVARRLSVHGIDRIFASSSNRAVLTATPTAQLCKKDITKLDWCHENLVWQDFAAHYDNGQYTWCYFHQPTVEKFVSKEVWDLGKQWYDHPDFADRPYKQGVMRVLEETEQFMLSLGYRHDRERNGYIAERPNQERVALFAHEGFGHAFLSTLLDIPYPQFCTRFAFCHTGVSVIEFANRQGFIVPKLLQHANDSHLFAQGLPLKYNNVTYI